MGIGTGKAASRRNGWSRPWSFALARLSPWPTWVTGVVFGSALLAAITLIEFLTGRPQALLQGVPPADAGCLYLPGDYRIATVGVIAVAYSMTARYKLAQWTVEAGQHIGLPGKITDADTAASYHWWGMLPGLLGAGLYLMAGLDIAETRIEWTREYWIFPHIVTWGLAIPFGWVGGRLIYSVFANAIIVSRAARQVEVQSLDDLAPVEAAFRHGSRTALISLMFLGIISVHFIDPGLDVATILVLVVLFVVGAAISALPTVGVVQNYYDRRDQELAHLRSEIAVEEQQLLARDDDYEPGRIGDLVSMEQRLSSWRVTVFHLSMLARLGLYVFIGLLSWIGAAGVSVVVESFFRL